MMPLRPYAGDIHMGATPFYGTKHHLLCMA